MQLQYLFNGVEGRELSEERKKLQVRKQAPEGKEKRQKNNAGF